MTRLTYDLFRRALVVRPSTGELMTLEDALRQAFDEIYDDPEVREMYASVFRKDKPE